MIGILFSALSALFAIIPLAAAYEVVRIQVRDGDFWSSETLIVAGFECCIAAVLVFCAIVPWYA